MHKLTSIILSVMLAVGMVTAAGTSSAEAAAPEYRVVQDRVIELTYNEFDFDAGAAYLNKFDLQKSGCSAVRVLVDGKVYVGRNYDFYCSNAPAFIIRNNAGSIRTIGIGNSPDSMEAWSDDFQLREAALSYLPYLCSDVMSETGLYCECNIRPYEEALSCQSTNPGAPRRCTQTFMQTMLTQYATINEVLAHLNDYDWFDLSAQGFEESFLLTDQSGRSVIIEFGANRVMWQEAEYNGNFFLNDELYAIETIGCGELRLAHELALKPFVRTEEDIFTMMEAGSYGQFYEADADPSYAYPEFYEMTGYNKNTAAADMEGCLAATQAQIDKYASYTWEQLIAASYTWEEWTNEMTLAERVAEGTWNERVTEKTWESVFIVAANVTDLYMHVHFSEHYGIDFTVAFD